MSQVEIGSVGVTFRRYWNLHGCGFNVGWQGPAWWWRFTHRWFWWRFYWQGIDSWYFGWRYGIGGTEGALMIDIGPFSLRVRG